MGGADGLFVERGCRPMIMSVHGRITASNSLNWLQPGDIGPALNAASHIGDGALQQAQAAMRPDTFTHGTSAQRVKWLKTGFSNGNMDQCNTTLNPTLAGPHDGPATL